MFYFPLPVLCEASHNTAKTSLAASLGVGLARAGKKVCIVDLDNQANLTMSFGYDPDNIPITIADILTAVMDKSFTFEKTDYILPIEGIDLIPSDISLAGVERTHCRQLYRVYRRVPTKGGDINDYAQNKVELF